MTRHLFGARVASLSVVTAVLGMWAAGGWAQGLSFSDPAGIPAVEVDLSVLDDSGVGGGRPAPGPSAGGQRLMVPGPTPPVSVLLVKPKGGAASDEASGRRPVAAPATAPRVKGPAIPKAALVAPTPKESARRAAAPTPRAAPPTASPSAAPTPKSMPRAAVTSAPPPADIAPPPAAAPAVPAPTPSPAPPPPPAMAKAPPPAPAAPAASVPTPSPAPPPPALAKPTLAPTPPPPPPVATAPAKTAEPTPGSAPAATASRSPAGALKEGVALRIPFSDEAVRLPADVHAQLKSLAARVNSDERLRLQLLAYAAGDDQSTSRARRVSLSRALAVRSFLIENGVRSTRIDVRALGDKTTEKPVNRVDVAVVER